MAHTSSKFDAARRAGELEAQECGAHGAYYDAHTRRLVISLPGEMQLTFPPYAVQGLDTASEDDLRNIELVDDGLGLRIERLDLDISIPGLLKGLRGSPSWMASHLGRAGGSASTLKKAEAARENGKRGGRPRAAGSPRR
jgi:hypothetical protein